MKKFPIVSFRKGLEEKLRNCSKIPKSRRELSTSKTVRNYPGIITAECMKLQKTIEKFLMAFLQFPSAREIKSLIKNPFRVNSPIDRAEARQIAFSEQPPPSKVTHLAIRKLGFRALKRWSIHELMIVRRCCVPEPRELRRFVSRPPPGNGRLHCTMLRHVGEPAPCYTLYLEYLGGLVPLLKGRRTSKIRPEFVIYDPQSTDALNVPNYASQYPSFSDCSDNEKGDLCGSPRNRRKNRRRKDDKYNEDNDDLAYIDTLPEVSAWKSDSYWVKISPTPESWRSRF